jgi:hypothetical protein
MYKAENTKRKSEVNMSKMKGKRTAKRKKGTLKEKKEKQGGN